MPCIDPVLSDISASEFAERMHRQRGPDDLPLSASLELTHRCNVRCTHCYLEHGGGELDTDAMRRVLDVLCEHGVLSLMLTGGEPLLRNDFRELYACARKKGFLLTLFTNATLVDDSLAAVLAAAPPRCIEVSMYGATERTYESVTRVKGSFSAFRRGVDRLKLRRLPLRLKAMVLRSNADELEAMRAWAETEMGVPLRFDAVVFPRLDGGAGSLSERLDPRQAAAVVTGSDAGKAIFRRGLEAAAAGPIDRRLFKCGAGSLTAHIDPRGRVHPCLMWRDEPYDLLAGSVREWNQRMALLRSRTLPANSPCAACDTRLMCPVCPAESRLECGTAGAAPEYFCALCETQRGLTNGRAARTVGG